MAEGVGAKLREHADGLSAALNSVVTTAVNADCLAKDRALARRREAFGLPAVKLDQHVLFYQPNPDNPDSPPQYRIIKYFFIVPGVIFEDGIPLVITKVSVRSTFEAMIKKTFNVDSTTEASVSGSAGFLGIPSVGFDISEKVTIGYGSENTQHNTFDVDLEMGQGQAAFGYIEIVKALVRSINKIVDFATNQGVNNPMPISESEAQKLAAEADIDIEEVDATKSEDGPAGGGGSDTPEAGDGS